MCNVSIVLWEEKKNIQINLKLYRYIFNRTTYLGDFKLLYFKDNLNNILK